jgi:hypothetical protein
MPWFPRLHQLKMVSYHGTQNAKQSQPTTEQMLNGAVIHAPQNFEPQTF